MMEAKSNEKTIGIEVFFSDSKGLGGKLRKTPDDFIVDEISIYPPEDPEGEFTIAKIRARNWETNRLIRMMSKRMGISRKRIGFAGTKDRRGVTTRLFSFKAPQDLVSKINLKDIELLESYTSKKGLDIGTLLGNRFQISINDLDCSQSEAEVIVKEISEKLESLGGHPNFFGHQRFGSFRPITHVVGKKITEGDFEGAVMAYLGNPEKIEGEEAYFARKAIENGENFSDALLKFPKYLGFEKAMLNHLVVHEDDFLGALDALPKNLLMMFVHAYQSYLFNRILSKRIKDGFLSHEPQIGDIVLPLDANNLPDHKKWIDVKDVNIEKIKKRISEKKAFISGLVAGTEAKFAGGLQGEIERKILEEEKVDLANFFIPKKREISSKGIRREMISPIKNYQYDINKESVNMQFELLKGCYATAFLREFMKTDMLSY
jgi:tRNA pseudouridine13 synthase